MNLRKTLFSAGLMASVCTFSFFTAPYQAKADGLFGTLVRISDGQSRSAPILQVRADADPVVDSAKGFVKSMTDEAVSFLSDEKLSQDQKTQDFEKLLKKNFDMKTIARFALGPYWKQATDKQQAEYLSLFEKMIIKIYSQRFSDYQGQDIVVGDAVKKGSHDVIVTTDIVQDTGEKIQVDWRVRSKDKSFKIVDVIVEGISMSLNQRNDFASVIQRGGGEIDVLLAHLREN